MRISAISLSLVLALAGCSDPDDSGGDGGSGSHQGGAAGAGAGVSGSAGLGGAGSTGLGGAGSSGAGGSGGTPSVCNTFEANAPDYFYLHTTDPPPGGLGGTIVNGTYFVTSVTWYESPLTGIVDVNGGIRIDIDGTSWQEANASTDDVAPDTHFTSKLDLDSPTLTLTQTCPAPGAPDTYEYTADAELLTVFIVNPPYTFGMHLTLQ